ncbi:hypothetical protein K438DRAFT_1976123 [Mycena galopus ATCC 62051]|nr:hypothetical protein K438DRAFT_1976123 [Mycena galopus ATCC 62051]
MPPVYLVPPGRHILPSISPSPLEPPAPPGDAEPVHTYNEKRRNHAESQARYRQRNLTDTRAKARLRMQRCVLRADRQLSEDARRKAAENRRERDTKYRERRRKQKFIKKFGYEAFVSQYLPLHDIHGKYLAGQRFVGSNEVGRLRKRGSRQTGVV